ncbi:MAG: FUSC family protein [Bacteroidota bacterium]
MSQEELSQLSDEELLTEAKKIKPSPIIDAFFIGFLIGIIVYSVVVSASGMFTLLPLLMVYLLLKKSTKYEALKKELKARGLS